ncbi:Molybdopterin synthase catalytic subunit [Xylographa soralifera]|nr:Molybdopterin synthase catalytic subunit [Xylographa soralifera]
MADSQPYIISKDNAYVELTHDTLDLAYIVTKVKSPEAGAIVLFAGMIHRSLSCITRSDLRSQPVKELQYSAYESLALKSMLSIVQSVKAKYELTAISMIHRLGVVPIGEESILIAVSSPHRQAAWRAGEEALEECKAKVEIWKLEEFGGEEGGVWRANRDGAAGVPIQQQE